MPGGAAISDATKKVIVGMLRARPPKVVVDLGTGEGESLATFLKYSDAKVYTVDCELRYLHGAHTHGAVIPRSERVRWVHAPLVRNGRERWYSRTRLEKIPSGIDLLLVDGPMGVANRGPAVPFFLPLLEPDAVILLDDARCRSGAGVLYGWVRHLRQLGRAFDYETIPTDRGLGRIMLKGKQRG